MGVGLNSKHRILLRLQWESVERVTRLTAVGFAIVARFVPQGDFDFLVARVGKAEGVLIVTNLAIWEWHNVVTIRATNVALV